MARDMVIRWLILLRWWVDTYGICALEWVGGIALLLLVCLWWDATGRDWE